MKAKKVLILDSGSRFGGGVKTYYVNLFSAYDHAKLYLKYISLGEWPSTEEIRQLGEDVVVLPKNRFRIKTIFDISKYLKTNNFQLIVSQGNVSNAYARAASYLAGVPSLVTIHSDASYDYPNPILRYTYMIIDRFMRFQTKHYIAVSKYLKEKLVFSGIATNKISVILNGVKDLSPNPRHFGENRDSDGLIVISSIGRLHAVKGYENLIKAVPLIKGSNWVIKIYGEGQEKTKLESLINELNINDKIKLCGYANDIDEVLSEASIYIQPSLSEGFGLTVVEAMGAGLPVIVTPVGSLPEIVKNNETGVITQDTSSESLAKSLDALLSNTKKARELGAAASVDVRKRFDVKKWAEKVTDAFLGAIK